MTASHSFRGRRIKDHPEMQSRMVELAHQHYRPETIAQELGISGDSVSEWLKKLYPTYTFPRKSKRKIYFKPVEFLTNLVVVQEKKAFVNLDAYQEEPERKLPCPQIESDFTGELCPIINGTDLILEEEADRILAKGREGITKLSEKKDYLSPGQLERRRWREVYNKNGFPEPHLFSGQFNRAYNPLLNKKKGQNPDSHLNDPHFGAYSDNSTQSFY